MVIFVVEGKDVCVSISDRLVLFVVGFFFFFLKCFYVLSFNGFFMEHFFFFFFFFFLITMKFFWLGFLVGQNV